ncbi:MAG: calcium-binding EGF-like domain-containing protein [Myxococcota bacterium]
MHRWMWRVVVVVGLWMCLGCAAAEYDAEGEVDCEPQTRDCQDNTSYRVCSADGTRYQVTECPSDTVCILGACQAPGTDDDAGRGDGAMDGALPRDTPQGGDASEPDTADDSGVEPEDVEADRVEVGDSELDDTSLGMDTRLDEDTSIGMDSQVIEDTAEDSAVDTAVADSAVDTRPDDEDTRPDTTPVDVRPDDPCLPNPCVESNRTQCTATGPETVVCDCDPGTVEIEGRCVVPQSCMANSCSGAGVCNDSSGSVVCQCDVGYVGDRCQQCDMAQGYQRAPDGRCLRDRCTPDPCAPPGPCEEPGVCDPDSGLCSYTTSALCTAASGNWRWTFDSDSGTYTTEVALVVDPVTGLVQGTAIDRFGLAIVSGQVDVRDGGSADLLKDYWVGSSNGSFVYTASLDAVGRWSGRWEQEDVASNNGPFTASRQTQLSPSVLAGSWVFEADFDDIDVVLTVDEQGLVQGTMVDQVGMSDVLGVFNRADGTLVYHQSTAVSL